MSLDWAAVKKRYATGAVIPTVAGRKTLEITGADDQGIHIQSPLFTATLSREHLEQGVKLIEEGVISRNPALFIDDYKTHVTDYRATSVAHVLRDLGFLNQEGDFSVCARALPGHAPMPKP